MGVYQILGGRRLCGTVTVQGSKNAVLPMIAAAVLTKEEVVLEGCPKISDVEDMAEIVRSLGGTVWWERNALHLNCEKIEKSRVEGALSKRLRASLLFLGSLLARTGEAYLAGAGGCRIGKRPTDLHQRAMELLGAEVFEEDGTIRAKADHPKGAVLCFPKKSVGATENAVLFAVCYQCTTLPCILSTYFLIEGQNRPHFVQRRAGKRQVPPRRRAHQKIRPCRDPVTRNTIPAAGQQSLSGRSARWCGQRWSSGSG